MPLKIHVKLKSREILLVHDLILICLCRNLLKFCIKYDNDIAMIGATFQNFSATEMYVMDERDFGLTWWRHQMETFSASLAICAGNSPVSGEFPSQSYWPFVRGIHRSPVNSPHKGQWRGAFMFSLIYAWINGWVNNREAGGLRRYRGHYDVIVMSLTWGSVRYLTQQPHPTIHMTGDKRAT